MTSELTPLEKEILTVTAKDWPGFSVHGIRVKKRENTGVGRFTHLSDSLERTFPNGLHGADYHFIEMDRVEFGLQFVVDVSNGAWGI